MELANISATHLNRQGGRRLNSYKCSACGFYHIGHNCKGKKLKPYTNEKKKPIDHDHEPGIHKIKNDFDE